MKTYTKTKINENKKVESSETAETPPPPPPFPPTKTIYLGLPKNKIKYHAE